MSVSGYDWATRRRLHEELQALMVARADSDLVHGPQTRALADDVVSWAQRHAHELASLDATAPSVPEDPVVESHGDTDAQEATVVTAPEPDGATVLTHGSPEDVRTWLHTASTGEIEAAFDALPERARQHLGLAVLHWLVVDGADAMLLEEMRRMTRVAEVPDRAEAIVNWLRDAQGPEAHARAAAAEWVEDHTGMPARITVARAIEAARAT